jgi:hypothetical protein
VVETTVLALESAMQASDASTDVVHAVATRPVVAAGTLLLLENGYTKAGCQGAAIPSTLSHMGVCGPMTSTFSGIFTANATDVLVSVFNNTDCAGAPYERRDVGIGACSAGTWTYELAAATPAAACVVWGYTTPGCPNGSSISGTVARRGARCVPTASWNVDQGFAMDAGGGRFNVTVEQYDAHVKGCTALSGLDLLQVGRCTAVEGWYAPYVQLECV